MTSCSFVSVVNFYFFYCCFVWGYTFSTVWYLRGSCYQLNLNFMKLLIVDHFFLTYKKWQFHVVQFKSGTMLFLVILKLGFIGILFLTNFLTFNFTSQFSVLSRFDCYRPSSGLLIFSRDYVECISSWLPVSWHICQFFSVLSSQAQSADLLI